jgi:DNA-directed RNA polymerase specialized sigma24 family protein
MHRRRDFKQADPSWDAQEAQWMAQMAAGGAAADAGLSSLFMVYGGLFVTRLHYYGLSIQEAQEVAQDLWLEVSRAAGRYDGSVPVRLFLLGFLKIARKRYWSELSKQPAVDSTSDELVAASVEAVMQSLAPASASKGFADFVHCVRRAFFSFEREHPRLARLLLLRHVEEKSLDEMAADLDDSADRLKAELFGARNRFRPAVAECLDLWPQ